MPALAPVPWQVGHGPSPVSRSATVVAVDRVAEAQRGLGLDVGAPARPVLRGRAAAAVEHAAEQVAQAAAASAAAAEQVAEVEAAEPAALSAAGCPVGTRKPPPNSERASSYSLRRFSSDST